MTAPWMRPAGLALIGLIGLAAPVIFPAFQTQLGFLWVMVIFALTWDILGGQTGYNSFGNILFFGLGMYATAMTQVGLYFDLAEYTAAAGVQTVSFTATQYVTGLAAGMAVSALVAVAVAAFLGSGMLGLRGHYFAIGTLGLGIAAGELFGGWDYVGAGSGMTAPHFPDALGSRSLFFYYIFFAIAAATYLTLRWIYGGRFRLAINAIRDDEDKAEAMGLPTVRLKTLAWCLSGFFLALAGGPAGLLIGFIDPRDTAFPGTTFGVFMVLMAIMGGKGTLWGPIIGAVIFHVMKEVFWSFFLGWQLVALGVLIVVIVVFFPAGIMGWIRDEWPELFGHRVDEAEGGGP